MRVERSPSRRRPRPHARERRPHRRHATPRYTAISAELKQCKADFAAFERKEVKAQDDELERKLDEIGIAALADDIIRAENQPGDILDVSRMLQRRALAKVGDEEAKRGDRRPTHPGGPTRADAARATRSAGRRSVGRIGGGRDATTRDEAQSSPVPNRLSFRKRPRAPIERSGEDADRP